jgi:hypothetical protein
VLPVWAVAELKGLLETNTKQWWNDNRQRNIEENQKKSSSNVITSNTDHLNSSRIEPGPSGTEGVS